jgi:hypothetical protein
MFQTARMAATIGLNDVDSYESPQPDLLYKATGIIASWPSGPRLELGVREHPLEAGDRGVQVDDVAARGLGEDALPRPPQGAQPRPQRLPAEGVAWRAVVVGPHGLDSNRTGRGPLQVAVSDVNPDGTMDLATANGLGTRPPRSFPEEITAFSRTSWL